MGLDNKINGVKNIKPRMVAVMVRPVRRRRMPPEIMGVKRRVKWVELGALWWSLWRSGSGWWWSVVGLRGLRGWPETASRSAIV